MQALMKPLHTSHPEYLDWRVFTSLVPPAVKWLQETHYMMWDLQVLGSAHLYLPGVQIQIYRISRTSTKTHRMARLAFFFVNAHCQYTIIHWHGVNISLYSSPNKSLFKLNSAFLFVMCNMCNDVLFLGKCLITNVMQFLSLFIYLFGSLKILSTEMFQLFQLVCVDTSMYTSLPNKM